MSLKYESPRSIDRNSVLHAIRTDDIETLRMVCINLGFHSEDADFLQEVSQNLSTHADNTIRSNALLGLEYSARFLGELDKNIATSVLSKALTDSESSVRTRLRM